MIKLNKCSIPKILQDNHQSWTDALLDAVSKYGSYDNIPENEKEGLIKHYRHNDIKKELFITSNEKCSFCECIPGESGYIEVEHFAPKSLYPHKTFDWENLLPSCKKCNLAKLAHDTVAQPIVNPYVQNPQDYFDFDDIIMVTSRLSPDADMSTRSINICKLNSPRCLRPRAELLVELRIFEADLREQIQEIELIDKPYIRKRRLSNLLDSLEEVERLTEPTQKYSAYVKWFLSRNEIYQIAKRLIKDELGL